MQFKVFSFPVKTFRTGSFPVETPAITSPAPSDKVMTVELFTDKVIEFHNYVLVMVHHRSPKSCALLILADRQSKYSNKFRENCHLCITLNIAVSVGYRYEKCKIPSETSV